MILDFYADWCAPCQLIGPMLERLSSQELGIRLLKINVDENQFAADEFGVRSLPTVIFIKDGSELDRFTGFLSENVLKKKISEVFR